MNKSKVMETVEEGYRSLIKEKLKLQGDGAQKISNFKIYIHCLKDIKQIENNKFPFKTTKDHLGIIFDRKFDHANAIRFWMFQEKKQKDKNTEYLSIKSMNQLITEEEFMA